MKVLYLSCAPRVSSKANSGSHGPRTHVLGVIGAFKKLHHVVDRLIVGDHVPERLIVSNFEPQKESSAVKRSFTLLASDLIRFFVIITLQFISILRIGYGKYELVYERYGLFMGLGYLFKSKTGIWILESNAILSKESSADRKTTLFTKMAYMLEANAYSKCDVLVVVSDQLKDMISSEFGIEASKIVVMPNGVDSEHFKKSNVVKRPNPSEFILGFVGSLMPWQNLSRPIKAINELRKRGINVGMTIVGDGAERKDLEDLVQSLGLQKNVVFTGSVDWDEVPSYISGFDVCYSGPDNLASGSMYLSPLKLYEYLCLDKPVIVTDYADAARMFGTDYASYIFNPEVEGGLVSLIDSLVSKTLNADFTSLGTKVRTQYSWTARVNEMLQKIGVK